jgi:2-keto-3-deoxy-L-rhamnonate aldolase RhmA
MPETASLKQRIRNGEIIIGVSVPIEAEKSRLEDILSRDTYGFVSVDSQHSPYNEDRLVAFCAMAAEIGIPVQFRIKHTRHAYLIGNILDLGPMGIEVPLVEEDAIVEEALAAFYYPQVGKRSWGGAVWHSRPRGAPGLRPVVEPHGHSVSAGRNAPRRDPRPPTRQTGD